MDLFNFHWLTMNALLKFSGLHGYVCDFYHDHSIFSLVLGPCMVFEFCGSSSILLDQLPRWLSPEI